MRIIRKVVQCFFLAAFIVVFVHSTRKILFPHAFPRTTTMSSPPSPLRLAIIEADAPQPQANAQYGGYRGVFTSLLDKAYSSLETPKQLTSELKITGHDVVNDPNSYPALDDIDAVLISGSKHNAFDNDEWILKLTEFTRQVLATNRIKVIGVCFGHQIVGRALNAKLGRSDKGWEVAVTDVELTPKGKEIFGLEKMAIQQMHRDIVAEFPEGAIPLGSNAICKVQAMYSPGKYITVQGHPEFTGEIVTEVVTNRHNTGIFNDEIYTDAIKRATLPHDGIAIARAFLKFLHQN